ncbi:hypothetical protein Hanom_Chr12g01139921 [Helianthus anomalus]
MIRRGREMPLFLVGKKDRRSPSIEVVTPSSVRAEDTAKKPAAQTIDDTLDPSNNLIYPHDVENRGGGKPKSPVAEKPKSPVAEQPSGSTVAGTGVEYQPSIHPGETELEFYHRSYAVDRGLDYHRPPWTVMQVDDVSNDPSACRDVLRGLDTPFKVLHARCLPSEKNRAAFEKLKQTETWAATADLKQVRTLAKLLSDERKGWREACARENEKLFRVHQELNNLKAANAALLKEKATAEAAAKEAEARGAKVLEEADADRSKLNKAVEDLKVEVQNRVPILEEVTARVTEAETRARHAEEIVGTILDAPENASDVNELKEHAQQAGFKAGYNECLSHVNPFYKSIFTDERSGFHGIDAEALYATAVDEYNNLSISAIEDIEKCLEAEDYMDLLRLLYERPEEEESAGGAKEDAGTSCTKED